MGELENSDGFMADVSTSSRQIPIDLQVACDARRLSLPRRLDKVW